MVQERNEPPSGAEGGKPKFLSGVNGVIAGLTGLVVAAGGLVTAYKAITDDRPAARQSTVTPPSQAAATAKEQPPAPRPALYKGDLYNDGKFNGGSLRIAKQGANWIVDDGDKQYEYDELTSDDKDEIQAVSREFQSVLRWPVNGGVVEESTRAERDKWEYYAKVEAK